tara:strand:+ start:530 stop:1540 length:1011 start_codon:yes stop_codon:yes gene_type:complete
LVIRIKQIGRYLKDTCKVQDDLSLVTDTREEPFYPTGMMTAACLLAFLCRTKSTRQMCRRLTKKGWRRFIGLPLFKSTPVEGAFRHFYPKLETNSVRAAVVSSVKRMRRAKIHSTTEFDGLRVLSVDGCQPFSTRHFSCDGCIKHEVYRCCAEEGDPPLIWYEHRIVTARLIGDSFSPWVGFISQLPQTDKGGHEGEITALPRLLEQITQDYGIKTIDVVIADALHATSSFIEECEKYGFWATFVAKGNAPSLQSGFESRPLPKPTMVTKKVKEGQVTATIWRQENIFLSTCKLPLQVLKIHQLVETMGGKVLREDIRWIASRIPVSWVLEELSSM